MNNLITISVLLKILFMDKDNSVGVDEGRAMGQKLGQL